MSPTKILEPAKPVENISELKALVEMYYDAQKFRLRGNNRMKALERGDSSAELLKLPISQLADIEKGIAQNIAKVVQDEPITEWLLAQRGIGPVMAAALIASDLDPHIEKPSSWWRFGGVGVVDGKNQRRRRGEKRSYNGFLSRTLYVLMSSFLKAHTEEKPSFYAQLYYEFKRDSEVNRPHLSAMECPSCKKKGKIDGDCKKCEGKGEIPLAVHHHNRATMLTCRVFLTHLQQKWRKALGLPDARLPYIVEKEPGIHKMIEAPGP